MRWSITAFEEFAVGKAMDFLHGTRTSPWLQTDFGRCGVLLSALPIGLILAMAARGAPAQTQTVLLTELVVRPTSGEFVEIHNPTGVTVDLSDYFLTDATYAAGGTFYYNVVTGTNAGGGDYYDFHARFPIGATIGPRECQTVSIAGSDDFFANYGFDPTYELYEDGPSPDVIPDMEEALPGSINNQGGLTTDGEVVVLYTWNGVSDLVADIDYALWGDKEEAVDKTGVTIDGPDPDTTPSAYLSDTPIGAQDVIAVQGHMSGNSFQRISPTEGAEAATGGNGLTGHDETSENLSNTWGEYPATPNAGLWEIFTDGFESGDTSAWSLEVP